MAHLPLWDKYKNRYPGHGRLLSSRVADARSNERPLHSTSQPANIAQRNRVPEETDARTVITSFDIVMGTAKVEEHGSAARSNGSPAAKVRIIF